MFLRMMVMPVAAEAVVEAVRDRVTLALLLSNLGSVITSLTSWTADVLEMIAGTPLLMVPIGLGIAFAVLGLVRRMLHVR